MYPILQLAQNESNETLLNQVQFLLDSGIEVNQKVRSEEIRLCMVLFMYFCLDSSKHDDASVIQVLREMSALDRYVLDQKVIDALRQFSV